MNKTPQEAFNYMRDFYYSSSISPNPYPIFNNIVFTDQGRNTFMLCVGFIMGIHASGNISLAHDLALNLYYQIQLMAPTETIVKPGNKHGHTYKEIGSDRSGLSFLFVLRREVAEDQAEMMKKKHPETHVHEVQYYLNKQYFITSMVGGIIFHGGRMLHHLEDMTCDNVCARWWSTHT